MDIIHVMMHDMGQSSAHQRLRCVKSWKGVVQNVNTSRGGGVKAGGEACVDIWHISPVVQERLILIRSGSGDPELQRWARYLPVGEAHHSSLRAPNVWQHRDQEVSPSERNRDREVSPTGTSIASRPGGLSYQRGRRGMRGHWHGEGQALALRVKAGGRTGSGKKTQDQTNTSSSAGE